MNEFSESGKNRPEYFEFRLGGESQATGVYKDIHEGESGKEKTQFFPDERQNQVDFGSFSHDAGQQKYEKGERRSQQHLNSKDEGYISNFRHTRDIHKKCWISRSSRGMTGKRDDWVAEQMTSN